MSVRSAILLASATFGALGMPAQAQDARYEQLPVDTAGTYDGEWQGAWEDAETWRGMWNGTYTGVDGQTVEANYRGTFIGETRFVSEDGPALYHDDQYGWQEDAVAPESDAMRSDRGPYHRRHHMPVAANGRPLGYSFAEREAWLADCRALYLGDRGYFDGRYEDDDDDGGVIGGLLGAVIGGIAGNRIADGERLGGTLIGAGIGGLAGLVIGSAIDAAANDRDDDYGYDSRDDVRVAQYCESYLRRYESSAYSGGYSYAVQAQPVILVRAATPQRQRRYREVVREEWVDVPVDAPAQPAQRALAPRQTPAPTLAPVPPASKLTPVK